MYTTGNSVPDFQTLEIFKSQLKTSSNGWFKLNLKSEYFLKYLVLPWAIFSSYKMV